MGRAYAITTPKGSWYAVFRTAQGFSIDQVVLLGMTDSGLEGYVCVDGHVVSANVASNFVCLLPEGHRFDPVSETAVPNMPPVDVVIIRPANTFRSLIERHLLETSGRGQLTTTVNGR